MRCRSLFRREKRTQLQSKPRGDAYWSKSEDRRFLVVTEIGISVVNHLQDVASRFLEVENCNPVRLKLIGSIPNDPIIPQAISHRQLLLDINAQAPATCGMNQLAESLLSS